LSYPFEIAVGELGLNPQEFWDLTYAEFAQLVEGYSCRRQERVNELIYLAWHIEAFHRQPGKLPDLNSLLHEPSKPQKQQTEEEMLAMAKMLNAAFGGEVVEI
jgi:hypothetical protein